MNDYGEFKTQGTEDSHNKNIFTKRIRPEFLIAFVALGFFLCGFFHIVLDVPTIVAKSNFSFKYTFVTVNGLVEEYNEMDVVKRISFMMTDTLFSNLIKELEKKGHIVNKDTETELDTASLFSGDDIPSTAFQTPSVSSSESTDFVVETITRPAPAAEIEVSLEEFHNEFSQNRLAFEKKYKGRVIGLTGIISEICERDSIPVVVLGYENIYCLLQKTETQIAEQLDAKDRVRIVGGCELDSKTFWGGDRPELINCIIAEMPKKELNASSRMQYGSYESPLTFSQLQNELVSNEIRAMRKYKGQRVFLRDKFYNVDETYDGYPVLQAASDFSIIAKCTLRMDQRDTVTSLDLSKEYLISAVFEDRDFIGLFQFTDGVLNPKEDTGPQVSQQTQDILAETSQTQTSSNKEINVQQNAYSSIESDIETPSSQQNIYLDADDKIISDYLSENLPDYRLLNANDYDPYLDDYYKTPWRTKADFDGNGHQDYAFIAARKSNNKLAVIILNKYASGYDMTHTFLDEDIVIETEGSSDLGVFAKEPGPIICAAGDDEYEGPQVQIGMAKYPYIMAGVLETDWTVGTYWWENGGYRSEAEVFKPYAEANPSQIAIVNVQDALNVRETPSTSANIIEKLPPDTKVIILESPDELQPWVKIQFFKLKGWVHGDYLRKPDYDF